MDLALTPVEIVLPVGDPNVASTIAGIGAGLLGVGIVIVAVLFWLFTLTDFLDGVAMHMAVATSLATIITMSIASMRARHKRGVVDFNPLRRWPPTLSVGVLSDGLAARYLDVAVVLTGVFGVAGPAVTLNMAHVLEPEWVKQAFAVFLVLAAITMLHSSLT